MFENSLKSFIRNFLYIFNRLLFSIFPTIFLLIAIGAAYYGLVILVGVAKEVLVAVIAGSASLLAVFFTFITQRSRELELAEIHRKKELELARISATQENYFGILKKLAPFIRDIETNTDEFSTALLHVWVVGSPEVVEYTCEFMKSRTDKNLDKLLNAMRNDVGLVKPVNDGTSTKELFSDVTQKTIGSLSHGA